VTGHAAGSFMIYPHC